MELLVTIVILSILSGLFLSGLKHTMKEMESIVCMNHLKQLGLAFSLYAADNHTRLPFSNASYGGSGENPELCWFNALDPHLDGSLVATNKASERLSLMKQDPIIKKLGVQWLSDAHTLKMNEWLTLDRNGTTGSKYFWALSDFSKPSQTVLLFDGKAESNKDASGLPGIVAKQTQGTEGDVMRRHSNRANVLFVDGHVVLRNEKYQTTGDRLGWKVNETSLIWKPWLNP